MLDRKLLRENPAAIKARLAARGRELPEIVDKILELDGEERKVQTKLDELRQQRNEDRKRQEAVQQAEARVHELEATLASLETQIEQAGLAQDVAAIHRLGTEYERTRVALDGAMEQWLALGELVS